MSGLGDGCTRRARAGRRGLILLAVLASSACADIAEQEGGTAQIERRPTYEIRLDTESSDRAQFRLAEDDDGIRVQTGPAGIAFRSDDLARSGDFVAEATFRQFGAPLGYREAYGIFVGGLDLHEIDQEYTYLLVRPTGDFLVKRRIGEVTETVVDWSAHDSVVGVVEEGDEPVNTLTIRVTGGTTSFLVNGVEVHSMPTARARPHGIAGVRVNHRLDVRVDSWALVPVPLDSRP